MALATALMLRTCASRRTDLKVADSVFRQNVMTTLQTVVNLYWDLLYYRENVRVAEEALKWAQTQLKDNTRQVEIGNLAAIEVTRPSQKSPPVSRP